MSVHTSLLLLALLVNMCWLHLEINPLASLRHERVTAKLGRPKVLGHTVRHQLTCLVMFVLKLHNRGKYQDSSWATCAQPVRRMGEGELEWCDPASETGLDWCVVAAE